MKGNKVLVLDVIFKEIESQPITNHQPQITNNTAIYDIKGFFDKSLVDGRL